MSHSCAQWRGEIGAYVVGAIDSGARGRVARHLAACAGCAGHRVPDPRHECRTRASPERVGGKGRSRSDWCDGPAGCSAGPGSSLPAVTASMLSQFRTGTSSS
jgi:hypothetical protein